MPSTTYTNFPELLKKLMDVRQKEQTGKIDRSVFENNIWSLKAEGGFFLFDTVEGETNWLRWLNGNFTHFHQFIDSRKDQYAFLFEEENTPTMKSLFELLVKHGGKIINSNDLPPDMINQAIASKRMYVDESGLGFIWEPVFKNLFPETVDEVKLFDECYPLEEKVPDDLYDKILTRIREQESIPSDNNQLILEKVNAIENDFHDRNCALINMGRECDCGLTEKINELKQLLK